jgi:hypothetical protein
VHNENNNIDKLFRSELSGLETHAPAFIKKNIDKSLFSRTKYFILFFIMLCFIAGTLLFTTYNNSTKTNQQNKTECNLEKNSSNILETKEFYSNFRKQKRRNSDTKSSNPNSTIILEEVKTTSNRVTPKSITKEKKTALKSTFKGSKIEKTSNPKLNSKPKISLEIPTNKKTAVIFKNNSLKTSVNDKNTESQQTKLDTFNHSNKDVTKNKEDITTHNVIEFGLTELETKTVSDSMNLSIISSLKNKGEIESKDTIENLKDKESTKSKNVSYLLSWTSGVNLSKSTYSSENNDDANYYQENNTDKINFEHNISANVLLKNGIIFGSGVGISRSSYDYLYSKESKSQFTTIDSTSTFSNYIYASTDTLQQFGPIDSVYQMVYDTTTETSSSKTLFNGTSKAHYLHIPFQIGYTYKKDKFIFGIQVNARYNILYKASGQFFENNLVSDFDKASSIFKKSYFDLAIKANVYYNVFDKFYVNTSFKYTPQLNNTYQNITIERKVKYLHIGLGISYLF